MSATRKAARPNKVDLLDLGARDWTIFRPADLDWTHRPWLIDKSGRVWIYDAGIPAAGHKAHTHAVFVNDDGTWNFLTDAAVSTRKNAPKHRAELESRARERDELAERQAAERERELEARRKTAVPVTADGGKTLASAARTIDRAGGKLEVDRRDRLIVSLPPDTASRTQRKRLASRALDVTL